MIINYCWVLEDKFGYSKEVTATMTDSECREKAIQEELLIESEFNEN